MFILLSLLLFYNSSIKLVIVDNDTKQAIANAEINYNNSKYITDKNGVVNIDYIKGINKIEITHVNYSKKTYIFDIKNMKLSYVIYLDRNIYNESVEVNANRIRVAMANENEVLNERIEVRPVVIKAVSNLNNVISSISSVNVQKTINGKNIVNIYGSEQFEINYRLNHVNLYSYAHQSSFQNLIIPSIVKEIKLELGSYDNFLATIQTNIDQRETKSLYYLTGVDRFETRATYGFSMDNAYHMLSVNWNKRKFSYNLEDANDVYKYSFVEDNKKLNLLNSYIDEKHSLQNILLLGQSNSDYIENVNSEEDLVVNGLDYQYKNYIGFKNNTIIRNQAYTNRSKRTFLRIQKDYLVQNESAIYKTFGDSVTGWYTELSNLHLKTKRNFFEKDQMNAGNGEDNEVSLTLRKKLIPTNKPDEEIKTVGEFLFKLSHYDNNTFIKTIGVKYSLALKLNLLYEFYSDFNYGASPLYNSQKVLMNANNDTLVNKLINTNINIGIRTKINELSLDLSYSYRDYKNYLNKSHGLIFDDYFVNLNTGIRSFNLNTKYVFNEQFRINSAIQYTTGERLELFSNKPKVLFTNNYIMSLDNHNILLNLKYESDKTLNYRVNEIIYQRKISSEFLLNLNYNYTNFIVDDLMLGVNMFNLLRTNRYTINGFYLNDREIEMVMSYEF